jgi:multidrug efflux pump subunit AcrB
MSARPPEDGARRPSALSQFLFVETTFAGVLGVLLTLGGVFAYTAMVKESTPDLAIPVAIVSTQWPGAAPELIEKEVTTPIEKAVKSLNALDETFSGSRTGLSTIVVQFEADAPVDESIRALRTKVTEAAAL